MVPHSLSPTVGKAFKRIMEAETESNSKHDKLAEQVGLEMPSNEDAFSWNTKTKTLRKKFKAKNQENYYGYYLIAAALASTILDVHSLSIQR